MGLEGVVSKRADAPYRSGRSLAWIKSKCTDCGRNSSSSAMCRRPPPAAALRSLLVAYHEKGKLHYARPCRHRLFGTESPTT